MTFPNAHKGISKVFVAQLLSLIGSVCGLIGIGATAMIAVSALSDSAGGAVTYSVVAGVFFVAAAIVPLVGFILNLVGLYQAGKDEENIRSAFIISIFVLIVEVVSIILGAIFKNPYTISGNVSEMLSNICQVIVMVLVITGVSNLAAALGRTDMDDRARLILTLVIVMYGLSIISRLILIIFRQGTAVDTISTIFSVAAYVFEIITYIMYLVFLGRGRSILASK